MKLLFDATKYGRVEIYLSNTVSLNGIAIFLKDDILSTVTDGIFTEFNGTILRITNPFAVTGSRIPCYLEEYQPTRIAMEAEWGE